MASNASIHLPPHYSSYDTYPKKIELPFSEANWDMHEKEQEKCNE